MKCRIDAITQTYSIRIEKRRKSRLSCLANCSDPAIPSSSLRYSQHEVVTSYFIISYFKESTENIKGYQRQLNDREARFDLTKTFGLKRAKIINIGSKTKDLKEVCQHC